MPSPVTVRIDELDAELVAIPDRPAVFLVWAGEGAPYLAKTTLLRRRLRRLLGRTDRLSRVLRLAGVAERVEYWTVGSQLEALLVHLALAKRHFPEEWRKITRLKAPSFVRLNMANPFPRTMITTRLGSGLLAGPFASRTAAERYQTAVLDLFQLRRCEENLEPTPAHPGCIYGEMNKCLRPCQAVVNQEEYRNEAARFEQFLRTGGASLAGPAEAARDRSSAEMQFEDAERWHQRSARIREAAATAGDLARPLEQLAGVAVVKSLAERAVELFFFVGGAWQAPRRLLLADTVEAGQSLDRRLREMMVGVAPAGAPNLEHLAILTRWHGASWREGEWIGFESLEKIPYRKIVNAVARVVGAASGVPA
jgi:excinuclease UvrABC nuclease subunit